MNLRIVAYLIGWVLKIEAVALLFPGVTAIIYRENTWYWFFICAAVTGALGFFLSRKKNRQGNFYSREGYAGTALSWLLMSVIGAFPFFLSGRIPNYVDALFEIVSGFTTTGASVLSDVESLGRGLLFWRSFSHWLGGMGVLVLLLAILPFSGGGSHMVIMKAESPGPQVSKLVPRVRQTALVLYGIYTVLTVLMIITYLISGMNFFDAVCIAFGTAGTGGFCVRNDGMASYNNVSIILATFWMLVFGVNFNIYYLILNRKWKDAAKSEELRAYLSIFLTAAVIMTIVTFVSIYSKEMKGPAAFSRASGTARLRQRPSRRRPVFPRRTSVSGLSSADGSSCFSWSLALRQDPLAAASRFPGSCSFAKRPEANCITLSIQML